MCVMITEIYNIEGGQNNVSLLEGTPLKIDEHYSTIIDFNNKKC